MFQEIRVTVRARRRAFACVFEDLVDGAGKRLIVVFVAVETIVDYARMFFGGAAVPRQHEH